MDATYTFSGNTYANRDEIKPLGARWDAGRKVWTVKGSLSDATVRDAINAAEARRDAYKDGLSGYDPDGEYALAQREAAYDRARAAEGTEPDEADWHRRWDDDGEAALELRDSSPAAYPSIDAQLRAGRREAFRRDLRERARGW